MNPKWKWTVWGLTGIDAIGKLPSAPRIITRHQTTHGYCGIACQWLWASWGCWQRSLASALLQLSRARRWSLVDAGIGSVLYWHWTDLAGRDDLRLYGLVQFASLALVLALCLLLRSRYTRGNDRFAVVALYALAKLLEGLDKQAFASGGVISGHTLKHLTAALACYFVVRMLMMRRSSTVRLTPA